MRVKQISIFLENKAGRLADVTGILADAGVNIRTLSLADTSDFGVLRLIVDDTETAVRVLTDKGITARETDVVAVEVQDKPGGLHRILDLLQKNEINVTYMYAFVQQSGSNAVMVFRFDQSDRAIKVLSENGVTVIDGDTIYTL